MNCRALTNYVRVLSIPAANELESRYHAAASRLVALKGSRDLARLHSWYKSELGPLLNKAEQAALLVGTAVRMTREEEATVGRKPFAWNALDMSGDPDYHEKLYGKRADELKYYDETCPICNTRVDEHGWCGCGTTGGG